MKIFISTDMEGIAEVIRKIDIRPGEDNHEKFTGIQTDELINICNILGDSSEITIRDAHSNGTNVIPEKLPKNVKLIQHFDGDVLHMIKGLDKSYDFVILHGYHAYGGNTVNPLAHTFSSKNINYYKLNGNLVGEATWCIYTAAFIGVPICYITGDNGVIEEAKRINKHIIGTETKRFSENESVLLSKKDVINAMKSELPDVIEKFRKDKNKFKVELPSEFNVNIRYNHPENATKYSNFPGAKKIDDFEISYKTKNFEDLMKMLIICR